MVELEFDIKGFGDTPLTPIIYVIQGIWCILVFLPLAFIVRCWQRFSWTRKIRTAFTMYLSGVDSASRLIFLVYYLLRLFSIYHDGLWMMENEDGTQSVITTHCPNSTGCQSFQNTISRRNCLTFSLFLFWASTWPMTSVLLLQIHALVASTLPVFYERISSFKFCLSTMFGAFCIDLVMGTVSYKEIGDTFVYGGDPGVVDACKFEYFSRLSIFGSWYVFFLLLSIGLLTLVQLGVSYSNRRRRKHFVNPVANSPIHGWTRMSRNERRLTIGIMTCSITSFILFIIHYIVYLLEGNSILREVLSITISVFAFFGPVELMWFNVDLRKAVFTVLFGERPRKESRCSAASLFGYEDESTENGTQNGAKTVDPSDSDV